MSDEPDLVDSAKEEGKKHLLSSDKLRQTSPHNLKSLGAFNKANLAIANNGMAGATAGGGGGGAAGQASLARRQAAKAAQNYQRAFDNELSANESNFSQDQAISGQNLDFITNYLNAKLTADQNAAELNQADKSWFEKNFGKLW